ncbi:hypothetical protein L218DRAFT_59159 [Marasmius fiardii PR-910]|nr:hypothetical protein L218DRAFT_59159 [Marasmius fiardii PR-910]
MPLLFTSPVISTHHNILIQITQVILDSREQHGKSFTSRMCPFGREREIVRGTKSGSITDLNNYFQTQGLDPAAISYVESSEGASDKAVWTVHCKINGQVRGTGVDRTKAGAKDIAAGQALAALRG